MESKNFSHIVNLPWNLPFCILLLHNYPYKITPSPLKRLCLKIRSSKFQIFHPSLRQNQKVKTTDYPLVFILYMSLNDRVSINKKFQNGSPIIRCLYRRASVKFEFLAPFERGVKKTWCLWNCWVVKMIP